MSNDMKLKIQQLKEKQNKEKQIIIDELVADGYEGYKFYFNKNGYKKKKSPGRPTRVKKGERYGTWKAYKNGVFVYIGTDLLDCIEKIEEHERNPNVKGKKAKVQEKSSQCNL